MTAMKKIAGFALSFFLCIAVSGCSFRRASSAPPPSTQGADSKTREEAIEKLRVRAFRIPPSHPAAPTIPQKLLDRAAEDGRRAQRAGHTDHGRCHRPTLVRCQIALA